MDQFIEFVGNNWELFLALAVTLGLLLHNLLGEKLAGYKSVEPTEAIQLMNSQDAIIIDVRTDSERKEGHIPNSTHIPLGEFKKRMKELEGDKTRHIVCSCRSGHRSASACSQLKKNGFENIYNLRGGILAWQSANLPTSKKSKGK